jgi:ribosomal-protein-alanine N-acetyltransferase
MSSVQQSISISERILQMRLQRMQASDLARVLTIENDSYPYPWTHGNFIDAFSNEYESWIARDASGVLMGYFLLMPIVDEAHLLNITVRRDFQGQGLGRILLDEVVAVCRKMGMLSVMLEVRPTNVPAIRLYASYGFVQIGRRKNYYPAADNTREDAIVMRLML